VITKNLSISVYLTSCSALSLDHQPLLIDTACRSCSSVLQTMLAVFPWCPSFCGFHFPKSVTSYSLPIRQHQVH
jgi:hypothetical protein